MEKGSDLTLDCMDGQMINLNGQYRERFSFSCHNYEWKIEGRTLDEYTMPLTGCNYGEYIVSTPAIA